MSDECPFHKKGDWQWYLISIDPVTFPGRPAVVIVGCDHDSKQETQYMDKPSIPEQGTATNTPYKQQPHPGVYQCAFFQARSITEAVHRALVYFSGPNPLQ